MTQRTVTVRAPETQPKNQPPQTTQLLLARLAIESALQFEGIATAVSGNQILLQGSATYTLIDIQSVPGSRVAVHIRSFLGEVLLGDEAQAYIKTLNTEASAVQVTLSDEGVVMLSWREEFGAAVDPTVVVAALGELVKRMAAMHTTLQEEFYLRPVAEAAVRDIAGGAQ